MRFNPWVDIPCLLAIILVILASTLNCTPLAWLAVLMCMVALVSMGRTAYYPGQNDPEDVDDDH
jgi:hypothetical protein